MSDYKEYIEGTVLGENEYLLKIREDRGIKTGFFSKLTQKGQLPKSFDEWGTSYSQKEKLKTYVYEEKYKSGWKLVSWRFGQSQNWASLMHPEGFTLEIYLNQFLEIIKENAIKNGLIEGWFRWKDNRLEKGNEDTPEDDLEIYEPFFNKESPDGAWEIIYKPRPNIVSFMYFADGADHLCSIECPLNHFDELISFIKTIKKKDLNESFYGRSENLYWSLACTSSSSAKHLMYKDGDKEYTSISFSKKYFKDLKKFFNFLASDDSYNDLD